MWVGTRSFDGRYVRSYGYRQQYNIRYGKYFIDLYKSNHSPLKYGVFTCMFQFYCHYPMYQNSPTLAKLQKLVLIAFIHSWFSILKDCQLQFITACTIYWFKLTMSTIHRQKITSLNCKSKYYGKKCPKYNLWLSA